MAEIPNAPKRRFRRRVQVGIAASVAAATVVVGAFVVSQSRDSTHERDIGDPFVTPRAEREIIGYDENGCAIYSTTAGEIDYLECDL